MPIGELFRVVEDDAERVTAAGAHAADAVAQIDPVDASRALDRPVVNGEQNRVALREGNHLHATLHARALLGQDEFAAGKIPVRGGEEDGDLQREASSPYRSWCRQL